MAAAAGKADRLSYHGCALCMTMRADTGGWTQFKPSTTSPVGTAGLHYLRHRCQSSSTSSQRCGPGSCPHQAFGS